MFKNVVAINIKYVCNVWMLKQFPQCQASTNVHKASRIPSDVFCKRLSQKLRGLVYMSWGPRLYSNNHQWSDRLWKISLKNHQRALMIWLFHRSWAAPSTTIDSVILIFLLFYLLNYRDATAARRRRDAHLFCLAVFKHSILCYWPCTVFKLGIGN